MKTLVVYRSKSGFAKKYAEWIAEELQADLVEGGQYRPVMSEGYDAVVYGGGLYVGGINGLDLITKNLDRLEGKRVAVFACGATPYRQDAIDAVRENFTPEQLKKIETFYMQGGFNFGKLGPYDKFLMQLLKLKILAKKTAGKKLHSDERWMMAAFKKPMDFTRKENTAALVSYVRDSSGTAAATKL